MSVNSNAGNSNRNMNEIQKKLTVKLLSDSVEQNAETCYKTYFIIH